LNRLSKYLVQNEKYSLSVHGWGYGAVGKNETRRNSAQLEDWKRGYSCEKCDGMLCQVLFLGRILFPFCFAQRYIFEQQKKYSTINSVVSFFLLPTHEKT